MCLEVFLAQGFTAAAGGRVEGSCPISHSSCLCGTCRVLLTHVSACFPGDLSVACTIIMWSTSLPSCNLILDNCLRAYSSSICAPHTARALSGACPISHSPCFSLREFWHHHLAPLVPHAATIFSFSVNEDPRCCILLVVLAAHYRIPPSCLRKIQSSCRFNKKAPKLKWLHSMQSAQERYRYGEQRKWPEEARSDRLVSALPSYTEPYRLVERPVQWKLEKEREGGLFDFKLVNRQEASTDNRTTFLCCLGTLFACL